MGGGIAVLVPDCNIDDGDVLDDCTGDGKLAVAVLGPLDVSFSYEHMNDFYIEKV